MYRASDVLSTARCRGGEGLGWRRVSRTSSGIRSRLTADDGKPVQGTSCSKVVISSVVRSPLEPRTLSRNSGRTRSAIWDGTPKRGDLSKPTIFVQVPAWVRCGLRRFSGIDRAEIAEVERGPRHRREGGAFHSTWRFPGRSGRTRILSSGMCAGYPDGSAVARHRPGRRRGGADRNGDRAKKLRQRTAKWSGTLGPAWATRGPQRSRGFAMVSIVNSAAIAGCRRVFATPHPDREASRPSRASVQWVLAAPRLPPEDLPARVRVH